MLQIYSDGPYAAFHEARQFLRDLGFRVPRASLAHAFIAFRIANCGNPQLQAAGADLGNLHRERNHADYDIHQTIELVHATLAVQAAAKIIRALDAARVEPTQTQVLDAIKIYERDVLKQVTWTP